MQKIFIFMIFVLSTFVYARSEIVKPEYVCMVNDRFMGVEQIPVKVNEKVYYGCCKMCIGRLQNNESLRYAVDPISGKKVDKAKAVILKQKDGSVLYFENESNANRFIKNNY
ncbi:TRASH domain-containing protein [Persephonella atlantica]|uniref:TRASH domain-containing protein n=1 Tax=Persephonella atlantica TaxID=2699429 RepID=A0ABS1GGU1_9AQUI|nr:TRASH domain-containing protein [Persephonella atlantica]MBK3332140.1 TRASH domain-containing protein [Persephonella atlantica]